jgi:PAS domain S-box-containing protein
MNDPSILVSIIAGLFSLVAIYLTAKTRREEKQEQDTVSQIESFQGNLLAQINLQDKRIKELKRENEELRARFDAIKNGVLTLALFGSNSPVAMWVKDKDGKRIYHNQAYEDMTGMKLTESLGKTDLELTGSQEIHDNWRFYDLKVMKEKRYLMAVEKANHTDSPNDIFSVLSIKWPVLIQNESIGVEGAAIRVDEIQNVMS